MEHLLPPGPRVGAPVWVLIRFAPRVPPGAVALLTPRGWPQPADPMATRCPLPALFCPREETGHSSAVGAAQRPEVCVASRSDGAT